MRKTEEKGITLVVLVITIVLLLILTTIGATVGSSTLDYADYIQFKNEIEILQTKVNELNNINKLELGQVLSSEQANAFEITEISNIIFKNKTAEEIQKIKDGFRYCNYEYIKNELGIETLERDYLINVEYRYVISVEGFEYKGVTYYMTGQFEDGVYNVDYTNKYVPTALDNAKNAMPSGAKIIEADENKGIVIRDRNKNEWVWIEVPREVFVTANVASEDDKIDAIKTDLLNYVTTPTNYRENPYNDSELADIWYAIDENTLINEKTTNLTEKQKNLNNGCGLTYYEYKTNYENMLKSIYKNEGFYIGRYETGDSLSTLRNETRTENTGIDGSPVSQVDQIPYNYVTCSEAQTLASKMKPDSNKTSSLMFGIQWDLVCKYIDTKEGKIITKDDSSLWGNYSNTSLKLDRGKYNIKPDDPDTKWKNFNEDTENYVVSTQTSSDGAYYQLITTGASEQTNKMNIYNLAGNEYEWTLEHDAYSAAPCVFRGGIYYLDGIYRPAYGRYRDTNSIRDVSYAFRATIY